MAEEDASAARNLECDNDPEEPDINDTTSTSSLSIDDQFPCDQDIALESESLCLLTKLSDYDALEGEAAKFSCIISGNPQPDISWYKDGLRIQESKDYSLLTDSNDKYSLVITRSSPDLGGCYSCIATNTKGSVESSAFLSIKSFQNQCSIVEDMTENEPVKIRKEDVEAYYELQEKLGTGGFGTVFRCMHKEKKKQYAAKFIKCRRSQRPSVLNEIDILNSLNHKRITKLVDVFDVTRQIVLVMELVIGGELFERLVEEEIISEMDVTFFMKQILDAVQHLHDRSILHLDLKPENIMLVEKGGTNIKIIDFGLARKLESVPTKVLHGSPEFVSPEVLNYDAVTPSTDMWSVGVITYVLLSGYCPFEDDDSNPNLLKSNIIRCEWSFDSSFDHISDEGKDFIEKLIIKDQRKRSSATDSLNHPWLEKAAAHKIIKTNKLTSFTARRNWKKSIMAVRTADILSRVLHKDSSSDEELDDTVSTAKKIRQGSGLEETVLGHIESESVPEETDNHDTTPSLSTVEKVQCEQAIALESESLHVLTKLTDYHALEGEAARFSFSVSGNPFPEVLWYKDGQKIQESKDYSLLTDSNNKYSLVITRSSQDLSGCYTCIATNDNGSVESSAVLSVKSLHIQCKCFTKEHVSDSEDDSTAEVKVEMKKEDVETYYQLQEKLGTGGFGTVFRCIHKEKKKQYAAKFIKCRRSQRPSVLNEIDILNSLNHERITKLVDVFDVTRQIVLVMELVEGGELFERLVEEEMISEMDVTFFMKQILDAVQHMHDRNILHLDLKPENIMLVRKGGTHLKIIDFGLARKLEAVPTKIVHGSPEFISPEVLNYDAVTFATDMWSVGVITYVLLSGFCPFEDDDKDPNLLKSNIIRAEWSFGSNFDHITDEGKDFIEKLIIKDQRKRSSATDSLNHPWLKNAVCNKIIKTNTLTSFTARRNWKKSIMAVRTVDILASVLEDDDIQILAGVEN